MDPEEIQQLLKTGIEAAQSGNKIIARHILEQVVSKDPANEMGWLWLASVVDTAEDRHKALQSVLSINPNNERARQAISKLPRSAASTAEPERAPSSGGRLSRAPTASTMRTTPPPQPAQPIFVPKPARQRRRGMSPLTFILIGVLAIAMIALGIIMLVVDDPLTDNETPTPSVVPVVVAATRTPFVTPGPSPTLRPVDTVGPTWTPSVTPTPTDTPIPTATSLPLSTYTLLASAKRDSQDTWALYTMLASGADERRVSLSLAALTSDGTDLTLLDVFDAAYSLDGTWIAFSARLSQGGSEFEDLFIAPATGGDMRRITMLNAEHVESATWSPDGQQIAFASDADGDFDVYSVSVDGGTPRLMTRNTAEDRDPAWSPDGRWIAYSSDLTGPGTLEVWRMSSSGGNTKQLTDNMNSSFSPAWSPDSQSIVFVSDRRTNDDLYIMNAEGEGDRSILVRDVDANELNPSWSPDGEWIAFSSNRAGFVYDLYLIRPDGTELQRVTRRDDDTRYVDWLP